LINSPDKEQAQSIIFRGIMSMKKCAFWACSVAIDDSKQLCKEHEMQCNEGYINQCPKCDSYKETRYLQCWACYNKEKAIPANKKITGVTPGKSQIKASLAYREKKQRLPYCINNSKIPDKLLDQRKKHRNAGNAYKSVKHFSSRSNICPICGGTGSRMVKKGPRSHKATMRVMCTQCIGSGYV